MSVDCYHSECNNWFECKYWSYDRPYPAIMHQASHGDADHDPYKYSDYELAYLYGFVPPHYHVPTLLASVS